MCQRTACAHQQCGMLPARRQAHAMRVLVNIVWLCVSGGCHGINSRGTDCGGGARGQHPHTGWLRAMVLMPTTAWLANSNGTIWLGRLKSCQAHAHMLWHMASGCSAPLARMPCKRPHGRCIVRRAIVHSTNNRALPCRRRHRTHVWSVASDQRHTRRGGRSMMMAREVCRGNDAYGTPQHTKR